MKAKYKRKGRYTCLNCRAEWSIEIDKLTDEQLREVAEDLLKDLKNTTESYLEYVRKHP